jgi:hypothetical protein
MRPSKRTSFSSPAFGYHIRCSIDIGSLHFDSLLPNGIAHRPSLLFRLEPRWRDHRLWTANLLFVSTARSWSLLTR